MDSWFVIGSQELPADLYYMAMVDPRAATRLLGGSIITGAILYIVVDKVLTSQSVSGGLWELGKFLISVIPVGFAVYYIFS